MHFVHIHAQNILKIYLNDHDADSNDMHVNINLFPSIAV